MLNFDFDPSGKATPTLGISNQSARSPRVKCPTVIGLYGVSDTELGQQNFAFYEGSVVIDALVPDGLDAFKRMNDQDKTCWREKAISYIADACTTSGYIGLVAGHFIFWDDGSEDAGHRVWTERDAEVFTHILYLTVPPHDVVERRANDRHRQRSVVPQDHIRKWQQAEYEELRRICLRRKIIFTATPALTGAGSALILSMLRQTEPYSLSCAQNRLDETRCYGGLRRGQTLIAEDTGQLFWEVALADTMPQREDPLKMLFSSPFGYSYTAFLQAAFIYQSVDEGKFDNYCEQAASAATIHPEIVSLLKEAAERRVGAIILTCGVRLIWQKILDAAGLSHTVEVIGAGRIQDHLVITGRTKRDLVARLRDVHHICVCAFGDSTLDLPMLKEAEKAIVVVGEEHTRSRSMEAALLDAIVNDGLQANQWLLPNNATPRLDTYLLPLFETGGSNFIDSVIRLFGLRRVLHATEECAAKLLMTPMRDARISGPALQEAHGSVGRYLATTLLPKLVGLEEVPIPHVQGNQTTGHRLRHERKTVIVALMRGGEPMALGVYKALPLAMFVHAKKPEELNNEHLDGRETVVLVDSVVNSGKSVEEFVQRIRTLASTIRIVVVAGVIQAQSLSDGLLGDILARDDNVGFISLRLSDNKYTGKGTTDTGNRLFNSTHID
ncbi:uracil phosphoribosyltransferase-domain-containing protein [Mycena metata]|uniref:Uracil phosphoribosyltransferase-domain-containing protein n=1 Tax=Mycena metata TaxID=1033252 RepID=A0AAD7M9C1_9AGAR|nr:uracil phosphoribosyltransferase-domain-containing protein [Mycena metata]